MNDLLNTLVAEAIKATDVRNPDYECLFETVVLRVFSGLDDEIAVDEDNPAIMQILRMSDSGALRKVVKTAIRNEQRRVGHDPRVAAIRNDRKVGRWSCSPVDECFTDGELTDELDRAGVRTPASALRWARRVHAADAGKREFLAG